MLSCEFPLRVFLEDRLHQKAMRDDGRGVAVSPEHVPRDSRRERWAWVVGAPAAHRNRGQSGSPGSRAGLLVPHGRSVAPRLPNQEQAMWERFTLKTKPSRHTIKH